MTCGGYASAAGLVPWFGGVSPSMIPGGMDSAVTAAPGVSPDSTARGPVKRETSASSAPSARLEQDEQRLGFLERAAIFSPMGSPQQMQTRGFMVVGVNVYR